MNYRFSLDDNIHAALIGFNRKRASGGSENAAMKAYIIERFAIHMDKNMPCTCQNTVADVSNEREMIDSSEINLSGLDAIFKDM